MIFFIRTILSVPFSPIYTILSNVHIPFCPYNFVHTILSATIGAVHKVRHAFLDQFCTPPSVTPCHTSQDPLKYVTHLGPPIFSSTCIHNVFTGGFVLVRGGFLPGGLSGVFCLEGFVRGGFCPSILLSECIHYNRKLNITFNFRFHMYEMFFESVTSHALGPPFLSPVTNCHTFSDPRPLERDILYGWPHFVLEPDASIHLLFEL